MVKKKLDEKEKNQIIKRVSHTMECEKMPLSKRDIENGQAILNDVKSVDEIIFEEENKMKEEGLID